MAQKDNHSEKFEWIVSVPIFKNSTILSQLTVALGIPFGLLCVFLFFSSSGKDRIYALGLIATLLLLTYLFIMLLYGGNYDVAFVLDDKGVLCYTQPRQAKKNRIVNGLAIVLGLLSGKPAVAGAGMLAGTKQSTFLEWRAIQKVKYAPKQQVILLRGGWTEKIAVFCTEDNYGEVKGVINGKIKV